MQLEDYLRRIQADAGAALALVPPASAGVIVKAGENLQAALDKGGEIALEGGATFTGAFVLKVAGTRLLGPQSNLVGPSFAPALFIPPGTRDVQAVLGAAVTAYDQACIQVGNSDETQKTIADVPSHIVLSIRVPKHRGKRAFAINSTETELLKCSSFDVYDPAGRDSQGVLILNTPGKVTVRGGSFEAASENILVGGAPTSIPNVVPQDLLFEDLVLQKPLTWKTDGVKRVVKNLFELKAGVNVVARRILMTGCWVDGQTGWAIMLTPRDGKRIENVLLEDITLDEVGGACSVLGYDNEAPSPQLRDLTIRRMKGKALASSYGSGRFLQWQASPAGIVVEDCEFDAAGTTFYANPGTTWVNGNKVEGSLTEGVIIRRNKLTARPYNIMLNGRTNAAGWQAALPGGIISGNNFSSAGTSAAALQKNLPADNVVTA